MILSKKEWVEKYVYKWVGIKNCDTKTVEGGYLFLWNDDRSKAIGRSECNIKSRNQAIAYHYGLYVEAQANNASSRTALWLCAKCGSENSHDYANCQTCGKPSRR